MTTQSITEVIFKHFWAGLPAYLHTDTTDSDLNQDPVSFNFKCLFVLFCVLVADIIDIYFSGGRPRDKSSRKIPLVSKIWYILGWFTCAIVAPISYWPELDPIYQEIMVTPPPESSAENRVTKSQVKQKEKTAQTSGTSNKKFLKQAAEYENTRKTTRRDRRAKLKDTMRMLQTFRTKWKGSKEEFDMKKQLTKEAENEVVKMERQVMFLLGICELIQGQLKAQKLVNKAVLQRYKDILTLLHKRVTSVAALATMSCSIPMWIMQGMIWIHVQADMAARTILICTG